MNVSRNSSRRRVRPEVFAESVAIRQSFLTEYTPWVSKSMPVNAQLARMFRTHAHARDCELVTFVSMRRAALTNSCGRGDRTRVDGREVRTIRCSCPSHVQAEGLPESQRDLRGECTFSVRKFNRRAIVRARRVVAGRSKAA